jgi:hypothetical protein
MSEVINAISLSGISHEKIIDFLKQELQMRSKTLKDLNDIEDLKALLTEILEDMSQEH